MKGAIPLLLALATVSLPEGCFAGAGERFAGESVLQKAVLENDIEGRMLLDEYTPEGPHSRFVRSVAVSWGIPETNLEVRSLDGLKGAEDAKQYRVVSQANSRSAHLDKWEVEMIRKMGALVVAGAGNPGEGTAGKDGYTVHYLVPDHAHWTGRQGKAWWERALMLMQEGRLIVARSSRKVENAWEADTSVHCGDARKWCYTVKALDEGHGEGSTSKAATLLASLVFLLDVTHSDPVEVLNRCAIDIGPRGMDRIFGRGLVSVDCPLVRNKLKELAEDQSGGRGQT